MPLRRDASCAPCPVAQHAAASRAPAKPPRNPRGSASSEIAVPKASTRRPKRSNSRPNTSAVDPLTAHRARVDQRNRGRRHQRIALPVVGQQREIDEAAGEYRCRRRRRARRRAAAAADPWARAVRRVPDTPPWPPAASPTPAARESPAAETPGRNDGFRTPPPPSAAGPPSRRSDRTRSAGRSPNRGPPPTVTLLSSTSRAGPRMALPVRSITTSSAAICQLPANAMAGTTIRLTPYPMMVMVQ